MLRFKDINSLVKYLSEELNKLLIAKKVIEEELSKDSLVDIIEIDKDGSLTIKRERITEIRGGLAEKIDIRIKAINTLLEEIKSIFNDGNYTGIVLLELENGIPSRVLLSQPLTLGEGS